MKVDVITRHSVANYGSILQSYATQKAIEELNHECEIIDYTRLDEQGKNKAKTLCKNSRIWNKNIFTRLLYHVIQTPNYLYSYNKFKKYRGMLLNQTTTEYSSIEELEILEKDIDYTTPYHSIVEFRKYAFQYLKGIPCSREIKQ